MMMVNKLSQISLNLKLPATPLSLSLSLSLCGSTMHERVSDSLHVTVLKKTSDEMRLAVANPV